ncbi:PAS domain-containing protein [Emcibacter nanhaiensis]|uniref:PAS domain-containing protein n=1 Tax=Emcibacter nanhaiensis TaxID=1505037 RepID=UPI0015E3EF9D|nr:PAS domain-containing protein [Emcibacter nanhaiensis]
MSNFIIDFTTDDLTSDYQNTILQYWHEIRGDRTMPARKDFNPLHVPDALGNLMLIDVKHTPRDYTIRLIGTNITELTGKDNTGQSASSFRDAAEVVSRFDWILENKQPYFSKDEFIWSSRDRRIYSALVLPFSENGEDVSIIFCCLHIYKDND